MRRLGEREGGGAWRMDVRSWGPTPHQCGDHGLESKLLSGCILLLEKRIPFNWCPPGGRDPLTRGSDCSRKDPVWLWLTHESSSSSFQAWVWWLTVSISTRLPFCSSNARTTFLSVWVQTVPYCVHFSARGETHMEGSGPSHSFQGHDLEFAHISFPHSP